MFSYVLNVRKRHQKHIPCLVELPCLVEPQLSPKVTVTFSYLIMIDFK